MEQPASRLRSDCAVQQFILLCVFSWVHGCKPPLCCCTYKGKGKECHAVPGQAVTVPEGVYGFLVVSGLLFFFLGGGGRGIL